MSVWPTDLYEFAFIPDLDATIAELGELAEEEEWNYKRTPSDKPNPILHNYINYSYKRLATENKIEVSDNAKMVTFDTGLVTRTQEPIFALFTHNYIKDKQPWHFKKWCRKGEADLSFFPVLPDMAHYFDDPSSLIFDGRLDLRVNIDHIITENRTRFPDPYKSMGGYTLQTFLKGAIDNTKQRVRRNYKTAVPQYYNGGIQLLLPLCIGAPDVADLALVVEKKGLFYRAATCLTLDMAFNNARQLARPDKDWLQP